VIISYGVSLVGIFGLWYLLFATPLEREDTFSLFFSVRGVYFMQLFPERRQASLVVNTRSLCLFALKKKHHIYSKLRILNSGLLLEISFLRCQDFRLII